MKPQPASVSFVLRHILWVVAFGMLIPAMAQEKKADVLTPQQRRQLDALALIAEDTDKASDSRQRIDLLREFLQKSGPVLAEVPDQSKLWLLRAAIAAELDYPGEGWLAGRRLKELGLETSEDPSVRKVFARLERKGWLGNEPLWREWSKWTTEQAQAAANDGDAVAQHALGAWYWRGDAGLTKNEAESFKWSRKAAEQGNAWAQGNLGVAYRNGRGAAKDEVEAVKWYRKAAVQGLASAQYNLGVMYFRGSGVAKDEAEAVKWYRRAAEQGDVEAQNDLAMMYEYGSGVSKDEAEAVKWYRKAAEQGFDLSQSNLGIMLEEGKGVPKDEAEAVKWYRKASEQGNSMAQNNLAWILATSNSSGIRNGSESVTWAEKAVEASSRTNAFDLGTLAASLAETGQFEKAVRTQKEAIAMLQKEAEKVDFDSRLKLYEAKQPYRQTP